MKTKLFFALVLIPTIANSQVTLTSSDIRPTDGYAVNKKMTTYIEPGNAGANQIWDFSSTLGVGTNRVHIYSAPSPSFPESNLKLENPDGTSHFKFTDTLAELIGFVSADANFSFVNNLTMYKYPMIYGSSITDTFKANCIVQSMPFARYGTTTLTVDGYGTLITPAGTFTDCLRLFENQIYFDSLPDGSFNMSTQTTYTWWKAGYKTELLSLTRVDYGFGVFSSAEYYSSPYLSISESEIVDYAIYPNPVNDVLFIESEDGLLENYGIYDLQGQEVQSGEFGFSDNSINVSALAEGTYYLVVNNSSTVNQKRFVKI